jgi:hypothetical protein
MKITLTKISSLALACLLVAGTGQGQTALLGNLNNDLTPVQSSSQDTIVQVVAEAQGLTLVPPEQVPFCGTFWMVTSGSLGIAVPLPCPPLDPTLPVFQISDGIFLVDGTVGSPVVMATPRMRRLAMASNTGTTVETALAAQTDAIVNLITQIQTASANQPARMLTRSLAAGIPSPGDGFGDGSGNTNEDFANNEVAYAFDTNQLWLEITNVSNGWSYLNLHNATNQVYAIWGATNLATPFNSWQVETEIWPTDTNCQPFTVQNSDWQGLFLRAEDWTGVTENGNSTPDWWFWMYFGTTTLSDTNLDANSGTLLFDYQNGLDPNIINFSLSVTNQYINTIGASVQVNLSSGVPYYYAVLVDDTNQADATWNAYVSSNIAVNLGLTTGWHNVWIGLRGFPTNATQTWQWKHLNLALAPILVITNPVTAVVDKPIIQIYGYCQEALASISYDLSNTIGVVTGLPSEITDQYYDTNACGFTTNYFECLDVPLASGLNIISIHATDLAGNITTTNYNFTLDYSSKTNPPIVQITWPQNGTQISGNSFTCQGTIDDPTATVMAQLVLTNGGGVYTNIYSAEVERNGSFWLENLPIRTGTNTITVTVTDAVGNASITNLSIVQSSLVLTINPVTPDSKLWQSTVNLTGTLSSTNSAVWVNGVKGHNNGNRTWSANNVPVNNGGTASFTATAYESNEQQPDGSYGN